MNSMMYNFPEVMLKRTPNIMDILKKKYQEKHRRFHTADFHLSFMFDYAEAYIKSHKCSVKMTPELFAAIWMHDYEYDIPAKQLSNEFRSAVAVFSLFVEGDNFSLERIYLAIQSTEKHEPFYDMNGDNQLSRALIDLDLACLSLYNVFDIGNFLVKQEYLTYYSKAAWTAGRIQWLEGMLNRKNIYQGVFCHAEEEKAAQGNLNMELKKLKAIQKRYYS